MKSAVLIKAKFAVKEHLLIYAKHYEYAIMLLLICLFSYTALMKFLEYNKFVFQMRLAPVPFMIRAAPILGWIVPLLESLIVLLLLIERWRNLGLYASFFLILTFEIYITAMLLSGSTLPCTCGGIISKMGWTTHLIFNGACMSLCLVAIKCRIKYE